MTLRMFSLSAALTVSLASAAAAQPPARSITSTLDKLDRVRAFHDTAISPDGKRVAWVEDVSAADGTTAIYVRDLPSGNPRRITGGDGVKAFQEEGIAWSPDSESLAFLSDATTPHQLQVWRIGLPRGGAIYSGINPGRETNVTGQLSHPTWSPDGKLLAVLFVAGSTQATGALVAYKPDAGVVGDVVEEQRIAIVDPADGSTREVSPANMYDYDWSPDGRAFAAEAVEGSGTNNYWIAQLYTIRADTGAATSIWKPPLQL